MAAATIQGRITSGIPGLDTLLGGGLIPRRTYVVSGAPGAGKTIFSMQFLLEGLKEKKKVLMVTLDEPPNELRMNLEAFEFDVRRVRILDAVPDISGYEITMVKDVASVRTTDYLGDVSDIIRKTPEFNPLDVSIHSLQTTLKQEIAKNQYDRVVIDSITALVYFSLKGEDERASIQSFMRFLVELNATIMLTVESTSLSSYDPHVFLSRGDLRLHRWWEGGKMRRAMSVEKVKGSEFDDQPREMEVAKSGITVFPDRIVSPPSAQTSEMFGSRSAAAGPVRVAGNPNAGKEKAINPHLKRDMG